MGGWVGGYMGTVVGWVFERWVFEWRGKCLDGGVGGCLGKGTGRCLG